jgi:uncharacterized protein (TIGR00266 family)
MYIEIQNRPSSAVAVVTLEQDEQVRAEAGAMVTMTPNVETQTQGPMAGKGGLMKGLKRAFLGGESFFTNTYVARQGRGQVTFAADLPGDMFVHPLSPDHELFIQGSSYVAAPDTVTVDSKWQGFKRGFLSGETMFFLHATGSGPVVMNAYGGIQSIDLDGELTLDTGHLVAFTSGISYDIGKAAKGWIQSWLSGEGFVLRVRGRGRLYIQSRNPTAFGQTIGRMLPPRG